MQNEIVKYDITDAAIAEMENLYMGLTIDDIEDKEQLDAVHSARMVIKGKRIDVEKTRKELKADALAWGKKVDSEAKKIFAKLEPIESHLMAEEQKVIDEKARIEAEAEAKEQAIIQGRIDELHKYGVVLPFFEVATLSDDEYVKTLTIARVKYAEEQARLNREADERRAEEKRLADEREKQEQIAKEQAEAQAKINEANRQIEADRKAIEDEKQREKERKDREAFEIKAAADAKIQAEKDAKKKAEREERERIEADEAQRIEKERIEQLRPDKEKIQAWISDCQWSPEPPTIKDDKLTETLFRTLNAIYDLLNDLSEKVSRM